MGYLLLVAMKRTFEQAFYELFTFFGRGPNLFYVKWRSNKSCNFEFRIYSAGGGSSILFHCKLANFSEQIILSNIMFSLQQNITFVFWNTLYLRIAFQTRFELELVNYLLHVQYNIVLEARVPERPSYKMTLETKSLVFLWHTTGLGSAFKLLKKGNDL